jgi:hypothetical protein
MARPRRNPRAAAHPRLRQIRSQSRTGGSAKTKRALVTRLESLLEETGVRGGQLKGVGLRVEGSGFWVWGFGYKVWVLGLGVWGLGFGAWGLGFGVSDLVFRISSSGFRV